MEVEVSLIVVMVLWVSFITVVFLTWFFIHKARVKERLLLIEKGIDPSQLASLESLKSKVSWLKIGIVTTGSSIGLIAGFIFESLYPIRSWQFPLPILLMFLLGGIGMILAHIIDKPKEQP